MPDVISPYFTDEDYELREVEQSIRVTQQVNGKPE